MTETYWNGLPTPAERVRVVVDTSPVDTWWCADLAGTERAAVRVGGPGEITYIDDENGRGWWKVTEGRGSPREPHWSLPVVREVPQAPVTREQVDRAVGGVLFAVSNYPTAVQTRMIGQDTSSLREKITDAVLAALSTPQELTPEQRRQRMCSYTIKPVRAQETERHSYQDGRFGDDGVCHARVSDHYPIRCGRAQGDRVHSKEH